MPVEVVEVVIEGPQGPAGDISGTSGSTANALIKASGTGGNRIAATNVLVDSGGNKIGIPAGHHLNFGSTLGDSGYGIRDNSGLLQTKHSGGVDWATISPIKISNETTSRSVASAETGSLFINSGATGLVTLTLPASVVGLIYRFWIYDTDGIRVQTASSELIWGTSVTSGGGYVQATAIGNSLTIIGLGGTIWAITAITGTWTFN